MSRSERRLDIGSLINGETHGTEPQPGDVQRFSENGLGYYAYRNALVYPYASDIKENERLDIFHWLTCEIAMERRLHCADLQPRAHRMQVLDIGYGSGIWTYEMAQKYPQADVFGIDLVDNQPEHQNIIPNVNFRAPVDFLNPEWGFSAGSLDFIHMRSLCGSVISWLDMYRNVFRHLRPGDGVVEHVEFDFTPHCFDGVAFPSIAIRLREWWELMNHASSATGKPIACPEQMETLLARIGFTDITHRIIRVPLTSNPGDGRESRLKHCYKNAVCWGDDRKTVPHTFEALCMALFTRQLGISPEQVASMCDELRSIVKLQLRLYHNIHVWTARKPLT